mmetsp:Transcript_3575/g.13069  ORF Transcript_3575/g.13069 Transcript_3575/m.13069 type:complete len:255 (+) Transcript_3575:296-1060(+)
MSLLLLCLLILLLLLQLPRQKVLPRLPSGRVPGGEAPVAPWAGPRPLARLHGTPALPAIGVGARRGADGEGARRNGPCVSRLLRSGRAAIRLLRGVSEVARQRGYGRHRGEWDRGDVAPASAVHGSVLVEGLDLTAQILDLSLVVFDFMVRLPRVLRHARFHLHPLDLHGVPKLLVGFDGRLQRNIRAQLRRRQQLTRQRGRRQTAPAEKRGDGAALVGRSVCRRDGVQHELSADRAHEARRNRRKLHRTHLGQ